MRFVDEADIDVRAGNGGPGCVSFLREKYRPKGGPAGGNGGNGGSVVLQVDEGLSTLLDFKYQPRLAARNGEPGRGKDQHGRNGIDCIVRVPLGTIVRDSETGEVLTDLKRPDATAVVAQGGRGGRGNAMFATSTNQAPRYAQPGTPGEAHRLRLELRLLADVGLVGFPNIGKSTLIARVSAARPRIADYPFTTIAPNLGVVRYSDELHFVLADIPGLIEGAHEGHGLGHRFLRHISRTAFLLHMVDVGGFSGRDPLDDFDVINRELRHFDPALADKPQIVAANKIDLLSDTSQFDEIRQKFSERGVQVHAISAATGDGVGGLLDDLAMRLSTARAAARDDEGSADRDERTART